MIVNVLQEDIDARCTNPQGCAVSRALQREFPEFGFAVTQTQIRVFPPGDPDKTLHYIGVDLMEWINRHDVWTMWYKDKQVNSKTWLEKHPEPPKPEPFQFEIQIPWQTWNRNRLVQVLAFAKTMQDYSYKWSGCIFGQYCDNNKLGLRRDTEDDAPFYQGVNGIAGVSKFLGVRWDDAAHLVGTSTEAQPGYAENLAEHIERIEKYLAENT